MQLVVQFLTYDIMASNLIAFLTHFCTLVAAVAKMGSIHWLEQIFSWH